MTLKLKNKPAFKLQDRYQFQGLPISIENKAGSTRKGKDPNGHEWSIKMHFDYGYVRGTTGADNEDIDVYIGPNRKAPHVYIVKQHDIGKVSQWESEYCPKCQEHAHDCACPEFFDEDKAFVGFDNKEAARAAYLAHYDNPIFLGPISTMRIEDFRELLLGSEGQPVDLPLQFITDSADDMVLDAARRNQQKAVVDPIKLIQQASSMNSLEAAFIAATQGPDASLQSALKPHLETIKKIATETKDGFKTNESDIGLVATAQNAINNLRLVLGPLNNDERLPYIKQAYETYNDFTADFRQCMSFTELNSELLGKTKVNQIKQASREALTGIIYDEQGNTSKELEPVLKELKELDSKLSFVKHDLKMMDSMRSSYMRSLKNKREHYMESMGFFRIYEELNQAIQQAKRQVASTVTENAPQQPQKDIQAYRDQLYSELERIQQQASEQYPVWGKTEDGQKQEQLRQEQSRLQHEQSSLTSGIGKQAIDMLMESSPVTEEEAKNWAERQNVTSSAWARLKKQGYSKELFLSHLAEYYQLTHGRLPSVLVETKGQSRANASPDEGSIRLDSHFSKETLFHELSHLLEGDKTVRWASYQHLQERTEGEQSKWLGELTGNKRYGRNERAKPDKFFHPYMGKAYSENITEILAMGIQELISPERAGKLFAEDRQTFEYMVGLLSGITPEEREMAALANLKDMAAQNQEEAYKPFQKAIRKAMKQVEWVEHLNGYNRMKYSLNGKEEYAYSVYGRGRRKSLVSEATGLTQDIPEDQLRVELFLTALAAEGKAEATPEDIRKIAEGKMVPSWFSPGMEIPLPDKS